MAVTAGCEKCLQSVTSDGLATVRWEEERRRSRGMGSPGTCFSRIMQLLEHEAKQKARAAGLSIPNGYVAHTPEEAAVAAQHLGHRIVVKAQVRTGGRGKAGGVIVTERNHASEAALRLLGSRIAGH